MSSQAKIIAVVLIIFVLAAAGYIFMFGGSNSSSSDVSASGPESGAEVTFLSLSSQLDPISFNTTILQDPRFTSLVDLHTAILPETDGRGNPFAPLSGISSSQSSGQ